VCHCVLCLVLTKAVVICHMFKRRDHGNRTLYMCFLPVSWSMWWLKLLMLRCLRQNYSLVPSAFLAHLPICMPTTKRVALNSLHVPKPCGGHSIFVRVFRVVIISVTWLITGGGGGGKIDHGFWVRYFAKGSNLKEGKIGPTKRKFFVFIFSAYFYLPLFNSVTK
jgi:hypothetical protein